MNWEELSSDDFPQAVRDAQGVCLVPLSVIERHGHHLPTGTDMLIGRELCRRTAALEPVIIFPDVIFTQILEARHVPGTIALDAAVIMNLLDNICREIARNGMKKIVLASAHGGNHHFARYFAQVQLEHTRDYVVYVADPIFTSETEAELTALWETAVDGHAGEQETSEILAIRPDLVRLDRASTDGEGLPLDRLKALQRSGRLHRHLVVRRSSHALSRRRAACDSREGQSVVGRLRASAGEDRGNDQTGHGDTTTSTGILCGG